MFIAAFVASRKGVRDKRITSRRTPLLTCDDSRRKEPAPECVPDLTGHVAWTHPRRSSPARPGSITGSKPPSSSADAQPAAAWPVTHADLPYYYRSKLKLPAPPTGQD